jgi:Ni/Co efflux regulator RcnB
MSGLIKAYVVTADHMEASILVYATSPSQAKSLAHRTDWACEFDWVDLRAKREPRAGNSRSRSRVDRWHVGRRHSHCRNKMNTVAQLKFQLSRPSLGNFTRRNAETVFSPCEGRRRES